MWRKTSHPQAAERERRMGWMEVARWLFMEEHGRLSFLMVSGVRFSAEKRLTRCLERVVKV